MQRLLEVMRTLRAPEGCPWDREQTHESLRAYLLEEAAEATDALATGRAEDIAEELGDVLLQIAFHAVIAEEAGSFDYEAVERSIVDKLIRRHPHVFAGTQVEDADEVVRNWQAIKAEEKKTPRSKADSVPRSLPALMRAQKLGHALAWPIPDTIDGVSKDAPLDARAVGELLLALVDYARGQGINPELALRDAAEARARASA